MSMRRLGYLTLITLLATTAGCGDNSSDNVGGTGGGDNTQDEAVAGGGTWPVTIEHAHGSTTIEERPEKIVSVNVQWTDALLALGVKPTAYVIDRTSGEKGLYPWQEGKLDGSTEIVMSAGLPLEDIAAAQPDLILVTWAGEEGDGFEQLSQIAPTIGMLEPGEAVDAWQEQIEIAGQFLGEPDQAQDVIAEVDGRVSGTAEALPGLAGKTFALVNYVPDDALTVVADPQDGSTVFFQDLGMEMSPNILASADGADGRIQVSLERVDLFEDADMVLILPNDGDPHDLPGYDELPAVVNDAVAELSLEEVVGINTPTPLSVPFVLDLVRPTLEIVAQT